MPKFLSPSMAEAVGDIDLAIVVGAVVGLSNYEATSIIENVNFTSCVSLSRRGPNATFHLWNRRGYSVHLLPIPFAPTSSSQHIPSSANISLRMCSLPGRFDRSRTSRASAGCHYPLSDSHCTTAGMCAVGRQLWRQQRVPEYNARLGVRPSAHVFVRYGSVAERKPLVCITA